MFLESRKNHYDLVDKDEGQSGDYQNYNFIRIQDVQKKLDAGKIVKLEEWTKIPYCCRIKIFGKSIEHKILLQQSEAVEEKDNVVKLESGVIEDG